MHHVSVSEVRPFRCSQDSTLLANSSCSQRLPWQRETPRAACTLSCQRALLQLRRRACQRQQTHPGSTAGVCWVRGRRSRRGPGPCMLSTQTSAALSYTASHVSRVRTTHRRGTNQDSASHRERWPGARVLPSSADDGRWARCARYFCGRVRTSHRRGYMAERRPLADSLRRACLCAPLAPLARGSG